MKATHTIHVDAEVSAPAETVWRRISKHAETHTWVLPARVRLLQPGGVDENGVGALREVAFPKRPLWTTIQERITTFDPPRSFSYKVVNGMPGLVDHLGTLTVESLGEGRSKLTWHVDFELARWHPFRIFANSFMRTFGGVLEGAVNELAEQLQAERAPDGRYS